MEADAAGGVHVVARGSGPAVVLVHGAMDRALGLAAVARHLDGRRVVRYDRRGYGRSVALGPGALADHARDLVGVLGPLGGEAVVVGHSYGGLVALAAAGLAPERLAAVGAYEPPTPWHPDWVAGIERWRGDPTRAVDLVVEHAVGPERWARAPASFRAARHAEGPALLAEMSELVAGGPGVAPSELGPVPVPAVLAHGSASPPHVARGLEDLGRRLDLGPPEVLDGPAHRAPVTHPAALAAWVARVEGRAGR